MEDYYLDEIVEVISEWNALHMPGGEDEDVEMVDPRTFLGDGGEMAV